MYVDDNTKEEQNENQTQNRKTTRNGIKSSKGLF